LEKCLFSSAAASDAISSQRRRMRGILKCYSRGDRQSLFRGRLPSSAILCMCRRHRQLERFSSCPGGVGGRLAVTSRHSTKALENTLLFWFCCGACWPAFHNFKSSKAKEHLPRRFQIQSEILRNLL